MERLNILWTTNDIDTLKNMVSMYSCNSVKNGWWDEVNIIIWGGSTRLVSESEEAQQELVKMMKSGVSVEACKACAAKYKSEALLTELGITVKYMSKLTGLIKGKDGEHLITI